MLVDKAQKTPADLTRVNMDEEWEAQYWCTHFNASAEEITACIARVGPRTEDVERKLREASKQVFKKMGED